MAPEATPVTKKRTVAVAVSASLAVVLVVAGLAFANSIGASKVAANAAELHWANATIGTSALTRAAVVQGATYVGLLEEGLVTDGDIGFAMTQIGVAYDELKVLERQGINSESGALLTRYLAEVDDAVAALATGDADTARDVVMGRMEVAYESLAESLMAEQADIQTAIDANTSSASRTNGYLVFILTLAIPATGVIVYWRIARRQVKEFKLKAEFELESERAVSKAKDSFIAGLSHELRTPLTSIYGFAEVLTDGGTENAAQTAELSQIIANEAAEMTRMVDDLLTASRLESTGVEIELAPTPLNDVIESAITPFERAGLKIHRSTVSATVLTDGARLRHVLVNLISNAARHGGEKRGIQVSVGENTVDIEVWDNGVGVPEDQIENLFERFIHNGAAPLLTGTIGLGLAVASRLTGMMGGKLSYQRFANKTYFIVNVPLAGAVDSEDAETSVADMIRAMNS